MKKDRASAVVLSGRPSSPGSELRLPSACRLLSAFSITLEGSEMFPSLVIEAQSCCFQLPETSAINVALICEGVSIIIRRGALTLIMHSRSVFCLHILGPSGPEESLFDKIVMT